VVVTVIVTWAWSLGLVISTSFPFVLVRLLRIVLCNKGMSPSDLHVLSMRVSCRHAKIVAMTTNDYVGTRPQMAEHVVQYRDWAPGSVANGRLRGWLESLRRLRTGRSRARTNRPRQHPRRADFVERAAMAREMHRL